MTQEEYKKLFTDDFYTELSQDIAGVIYDNKKSILSIKSLFKKSEFKAELVAKLKPLIEKFYDDYIFYLDYWKNDASYHGWDWSEDDGRMENQATITDRITEKFKEIYSLILAGLGERCENND